MKHYLKPGRTYPGYRCPAGPGKRDIPAEGRWYELDAFLSRRVACGDVRIADDEAPDDNAQPDSDAPSGDHDLGLADERNDR